MARLYQQFFNIRSGITQKVYPIQPKTYASPNLLTILFSTEYANIEAILRLHIPETTNGDGSLHKTTPNIETRPPKVSKILLEKLVGGWVTRRRGFALGGLYSPVFAENLWG